MCTIKLTVSVVRLTRNIQSHIFILNRDQGLDSVCAIVYWRWPSSGAEEPTFELGFPAANNCRVYRVGRMSM